MVYIYHYTYYSPFYIQNAPQCQVATLLLMERIEPKMR